ncbi:hypothetical protein BABINDRAFT_163534 [Babjeviella inositovora NRRL Y-12698]|uniref:Zinc/iron permease n=1 Tax=Babjeviella inositovora NRRL Y-12698 TaxID=984486 RepID=A0A1E3QIK8_9ASCO|nr:uncharacterized protein BABINDRAFT_163534 [Babjeviella inositovora NRRL Y-12698]ODQ77536.1 hypothetical protein BABINDRAFT_163534 [Babjeviella inositovora NRRL Y-12698]
MCAVGCCTIYVDYLYNLLLPRFVTSRYRFTLINNYAFLIASLALSAGCLILTSLYKLLPSTYRYLYRSYYPTPELEDGLHEREIQMVLSVCFIGGMVLCSGFNALIHIMTSESVVHCSHGDDSSEVAESSSHHSHSQDPESHSHSHSHASETTPLVRSPLIKKKSLVDVLSDTFHRPKTHKHAHTHDGSLSDDGECMGYQSAEACLFETKGEHQHPVLHFCEVPGDMVELRQAITHRPTPHEAHSFIKMSVSALDTTPTTPPSDEHTKHTLHHHHITPPLSRLLSISLQTTIAITLHKLPEGFITFVSSNGGGGKEEQAIGLSIFVSLLIHNFVEGFSMTLPLYYSLNSRAKAIAITGCLSVLSQPLGALLGVWFMDTVYSGDHTLAAIDYTFGILMGITAGFLNIIGLQMFASAISFGGSHRVVLTWSMVGMSVLMFSYALVG